MDRPAPYTMTTTELLAEWFSWQDFDRDHFLSPEETERKEALASEINRRIPRLA